MRRHSALPLSLAAGVAALVLTAGPALAATTYTVKSGSTTSGSTTYTAATTTAITFKTSGGLTLGCDSGTAQGAVKLGKGLAGAGLGTITGTTFKNCRGPAGLTLNVAQVGTWKLNATGATKSNVTPGTITAINAKVSDSAGACSFVAKGSVKGSITTSSSNQALTVSPAAMTLTLSNVSGCFGQVVNGDKASFGATYAVNAAKGALSISNP